MKQTEIDAWITFIDDLSKVVIVDQHYSAPSKSSCGAPDNWEILHTDATGLIEAQQRSAQFCQTWR